MALSHYAESFVPMPENIFSEDAVFAPKMEESPPPLPDEAEKKGQKTETLIRGEKRLVFFDPRYLGHSDQMPREEQEFHLLSPLGEVHGRTDYGGPSSKYIDRGNEDGMLAFIDGDGNLIMGVFDEAGGGSGQMKAGRLAGETIAKALAKKAGIFSKRLCPLEEAMRQADAVIAKEAPGDYVCAITVRVNKVSGEVEMTWSGDVKATVFREGRRILETKMQNLAVLALEEEGKNPSGFFRHPDRNAVVGGLGMLKRKGVKQPESDLFGGRNGDRIVLASDGLWDIVSVYEVEELSRKCRTARELQEKLFELAYRRNNASLKNLATQGREQGEFTIKYDPNTNIPMLFAPGKGDNITVVVVELENLSEG